MRRRVERDDDRWPTEVVGEFTSARDERTVPEVNAVEVPNGGGTADEFGRGIREPFERDRGHAVIFAAIA